MAEDTEVVRQVLKGDIESFRLLVDRYNKPVMRFIRNISGGRDCEDVAQDVFVSAYEKLGSFDPARSNFSTWIFTIARNKSINALKRKRVFSTSNLMERHTEDCPSDDIANRELFEELDRKLDDLPSRQKRAIVMAEFEGLPYEQIAQIEGVRTGTIKSRISRAKDKLAKALEKFRER
jgi:RNA polymerase sigma-70 factor (ECF subfamily)